MVLTIKATLIQGPRPTDDWQGVFEVDSASALEDIHLLVQSALDFDDDHLYEFFIARTHLSRSKLVFDDENGGLYDISIGSLFPIPDKKSLYYLFDYGNCWVFKISKGRQIARQPSSDKEYPRLVQESGSRPRQYLFEYHDVAYE